MTVWTYDSADKKSVYRENPDGSFESHLVESAEIQAWMAEGNEPLPAPDPDPSPVPAEIEGWQGEVIMRAERVDAEDPESQSVWDRVQDLISGMPDGIEKTTAQVVLQRGKIRRDSPTLAQLAPLVPLTDERIDNMFRDGAQLLA